MSVYEVARDSLNAVVAWYSEQIFKERRSATPNEERLARLIEEQRACVADRRTLDEADPEEITRISAIYLARYKELSQ